MITSHFQEFFYPKKSTIFLGKSKLNFWTKNEDFEQCVKVDIYEMTSPKGENCLFLDTPSISSLSFVSNFGYYYIDLIS